MVVEENRRSMKSNVAYILEREFRTGEQIFNTSWSILLCTVGGSIVCFIYFPAKVRDALLTVQARVTLMVTIYALSVQLHCSCSI